MESESYISEDSNLNDSSNQFSDSMNDDSTMDAEDYQVRYVMVPPELSC